MIRVNAYKKILKGVEDGGLQVPYKLPLILRSRELDVSQNKINITDSLQIRKYLNNH